MKTRIVNILSVASLLIGFVYAEIGNIVGGQVGQWYIHCDETLWHCTGTDQLQQATFFEELGDARYSTYPYRQYRVQGTNLCLRILDYNEELSLYTCTAGLSPATNELWKFTNINGAAQLVSKYKSDQSVWWQGLDLPLVTVPACGGAWECRWWFQPKQA